MAEPKFDLTDVTTQDGILCRLLSFEIPGGIATPEEFALAVQAIEPQLQGKHPILINGRGPVWGFAMLIHAAHATPAVGTFDPRLGYVITQTHDVRFTMGQVIELVD
jgi:CRISPR-associated protein Csx3